MKKSLKKILAVLIPVTVAVAAASVVACVFGKAWVLAVILPVYAITVFFTVVLNAETTGVGVGSLDGAYAKVISDIEGIVDANPRYVDIAVLGSHDAVTDKLTSDAPLDYHDRQNKLFAKFEKAIAGFAYRFGKTQTVGIYEQILQGSRFLHIKCTYFEGEWYCSHAHLCGKLGDHLTEALRYLTSDDAKGEIIGFLFQTMYMAPGITLDDLTEYMDSVKVNGKSIFDFVRVDTADIYDDGMGGTRVGDLRYNDLTVGGTEPGVVIFLRRERGLFLPEWDGSGALTNKCYDMDTAADHAWHSSIGIKKLLVKVHANATRIAQDSEKKGKLRMNQSQASLAVNGADEVCSVIFGWSLLRFAKSYNVALLEHEHFDKWLTHMPVFQADFINSDYMDFNARVNAAIKEHNRATVKRLLGEKQ